MQAKLKHTLSGMVRAGLCTAITFGLMSGSALAVEVSEEDYKLLQSLIKAMTLAMTIAGRHTRRRIRPNHRPAVTKILPVPQQIQSQTWFSSRFRINITGKTIIPAVIPISF